jgi:hypothetical protein
VVSGTGLSMKDADRLLFLSKLRDAMADCLESIRTLNREQIKLNETRLRKQADMQFLKKLNTKQ